MIQEANTSNISRLTELLAAHGVYALTIIFIFYQQWRAGRNLKVAAPEDHDYFRKVHASVITATYVLVLISTSVWIYATFVYHPKNYIYIRAWLSGLTDQPASPQKQGDPPKITEKIAPESHEIDLYVSTKIKDETSTDGKYDLGWVLWPHQDVQALVFRFQHRYERIRSAKRASLDPIASMSNLETKKIEKRFTIDLRKIDYSPGNSIQLMYEPDSEDPVEKIGKMYMRTPDGVNRMAISWEDVTPEQKIIENHKNNFSFPSADIVYASLEEKAAFKENGDYDRQLGRILRERLGSSDLKTQLAARDVLVNNGKRSFKFILDTLNDPSDTSDNRGLLISNLASVVLDIESAGNVGPRNIHLTLGKAFFGLHDYQSSAQFFDKAAKQRDDPPELYFDRGVAYFETKQYEKAIKNLDEYVEKDHRPYPQAVTHTLMAANFEKLGRDREAISHYKKAIDIYPNYSLSYNDLAYLYAGHGEKLEDALHLVNRALTLEKDPDKIASVKDTKGWILYKMGRYEEALSSIKEAAARIPDDPDIREHLKVIQEVSARPPQKNK